VNVRFNAAGRHESSSSTDHGGGKRRGEGNPICYPTR
jgi:hypothetical protein